MMPAQGKEIINMAEETLGFVELEWECKKCQTRNAGTVKICARCGSPMGEKDQFQTPGEQRLMSAEEAQQKTGGGPDLHCYFCNARNAANAQSCVNCHADLTKGRARQAGQVLGEHQSGPAADIVCGHCKTPNLASAFTCKQCQAPLRSAPGAQGPTAPAKKSSMGLGVIGCLGVAVLGAVLFFVFGLRTKDAFAVVQSLSWERTIAIQEQKPTTKSDWADSIPAGAERGSCTKKVRKTQDQPAPDAEKVCEKAKMVDQGNGTAKVVQNCQYKIYDQWCDYKQLDWQDVNSAKAAGKDQNPKWPETKLKSGQREGKRSEEYKVEFKSDKETLSYSPKDEKEFSKFAAGSKWVLKVNSFGSVSEALPAK